jgi:hypothetical protein
MLRAEAGHVPAAHQLAGGSQRRGDGGPLATVSSIPGGAAGRISIWGQGQGWGTNVWSWGGWGWGLGGGSCVRAWVEM